MSEKPYRVQLSRKKGWRMPDNTMSVARPGRWGNPFRMVNEEGFPLIVWKDGSGCYNSSDPSDLTNWHNVNKHLVALFRERAVDGLPNLAELRGKNLACWCALDEACHADVLLELANSTPAASQTKPRSEAVPPCVPDVEAVRDQQGDEGSDPAQV